MDAMPKRTKCEECKTKAPAFVVPGEAGNFDNVHSFLFQICGDCIAGIEKETGQKGVAIKHAPAKFDFTWRELSPREQSRGI